jgi:hypothetical protein
MGIYNNSLITTADKPFLISTVFVLLCIHTVLDILLEEAFSCLTEGRNDAGIDGLYCELPQDGESIVTIFQGKYGSLHFPVSSI